MNNATFYDLFCEAYKCLPEDFNEAVLWLCLFPNVVFLARLIWRVNRDYFQPDFELIEQVKTATGPEEVADELNDFHYHHPPTGPVRGWLKVRISTHRLQGLANRLFAQAGSD
jgi:hypothetical protein